MKRQCLSEQHMREELFVKWNSRRPSLRSVRLAKPMITSRSECGWVADRRPSTSSVSNAVVPLYIFFVPKVLFLHPRSHSIELPHGRSECGLVADIGPSTSSAQPSPFTSCSSRRACPIPRPTTFFTMCEDVLLRPAFNLWLRVHLPLTGILFCVASRLGEDVLFKLPLSLMHPSIPKNLWF